MSNDSNDSGQDRIIDDGPGMGVDDFKRKPVGDHVFETTLTVDQSKRILRATRRHDVNFRRMTSGAKLEGLIEVMRKDGWVWTDADPIRLHLDVASAEVVCTDGQHRLYAAARARRTLRTLVLWGEMWRAGVHVDRNRTRTVAQYLQHEHGLKSAPVYAAATRYHLAREVAVQLKMSAAYARNYLDDDMVIAFILKHLDALRWVTNHGHSGGALGFSTTGYHVMLLELYLIRADVAADFHADLLNHELPAHDPLAQLRRSVGRRYNDTGVRMSTAYTVANLVKAHNIRSSGDTLSKWVNVTSDEIVFPAGFKLEDQQ